MNFAQQYGAPLQALGALGGSVAQLRSNIYNANVAKAERDATLQSAAYDEARYRRTAMQTMARARANMAAAGVSTTSGTPLLLELDSARQAELEALNIRRTGQIRALSYDTRTDYLTPLAQGLTKAGSILSGWIAPNGSGKQPWYGTGLRVAPIQ